MQAVEAPRMRTKIETAEMVKYVCNAFHALKVVFANEIACLAKAHEVDGREVMEIFCRDRRLNISEAYLRPGFAFGGSCLPKDSRALVYEAKLCDVECPLLGSVLESNQKQIARAIELVERTRLAKRWESSGLSFKAGTDDVRESPVVPLVETLLGRGYQVSVYDEVVEPGAADRPQQDVPRTRASAHRLAHAVDDRGGGRPVRSPGDRQRQCGLSPRPAMARDDQTLIDLVGLGQGPGDRTAKYQGIGW